MARTYQIGELASRIGVSIRTLRHYDSIGLLRPSGRTDSGYRLYSEADVLRLQRILTLRYLGFSLREIAEALTLPGCDQVDMLRAQRGILRARIEELQRLERTVGRLLERRLVTGQWEWELVIAASVDTQAELERGEHHVTPEERKRQFEELGKQVGPDEIKAVERGWADLLAEIRAHPGLDPASAEAQALGERWDSLLQATFRGRTELMRDVAEGYANGEYATVEGAPTADDFAFYHRVVAARKAQD